MELYEYARPEVMAGKKILYLHGFASSGQNGTVKTLRTLLPQTEIIAPDIPVEPAEAMEMLRGLCASEKPDLIIGTSMGAMYGEQLNGFWRILVNPAFQLADTILKNNGLGRQDYHNPRLDGQTSFLVNKGLLESFRECSSHCFEHNEEDAEKVYGLFGIHDNLVHTFDLFNEHYPNAIRFDGEHYMNDSIVLHSVMPVIQWIDDRQEGRAKKTVMIAIEDTLDTDPVPVSVKAFRKLCESYDCYVLASAEYNKPEKWAEAVKWTEDHIGVHAWDKVIMANRKDLIFGDYLIDRHVDRHNVSDFMGTVIEFGSDTFKNWEDVLTFFGRLGGQ
ncbi:MAG: esterase [Bacteroidales bacterium]|nr:esterase [Bacteroidales bacterium]